jgi:hypothetical protein
VVNLGRAKGNTYGPGNTSGLVATVGAANAGVGVIEIQQLEYGTFGMSPTSGTGIRLKKASTNVAVFNYCDTAGAKTLIDATTNAAMPAASDVRSGVSYASGALTGSCAVPAAGSVALGVAVDAGFGTAVLTPEAVWGHASRTITGGLVDTATTLTNSPDVPTESEIASAVRTELDSNSTKLANLDASISSRLAGSAYTAPANSDISAIKSKTDNIPASPAAVSDIPTAAQISAAVEGSLLNEGDGQAVLNAIVGAIGNQNLSEVSLVAAIRSDLERTGGKIDSIPTDSAPSAASVAAAVWSAATKEITGGVVDTLTNSPDVPTEAEIATAVWGASTKEITGGTVTNLTNAPASVTPADIWDYNARTLTSASGPTAVEIRQEIDANSTKLDVAVGTRLAGSSYTAPANSEVAAVKAVTDALNTERLANVATTAIVGNLIAQANS